MPHVILDYTANLDAQLDATKLLRQLYEVMLTHADCRVEDLKLRAVRHEVFIASDGSPEKAYVYAAVRFLAGRLPELKKALGDALLQTLSEHFNQRPGPLAPQLCVELIDIDRACYFKTG
jgi:5-carboxymethyl-2-hydroxymuconate isomerase